MLRNLRRIASYGASLALLAACSIGNAPKLDAADIRFAEFYSDYLQHSGIKVEDRNELPVVLSSAEADSLFKKHGLNREIFDRKLQKYSNEPKLWREVLVQVRKDLRKTQP